MAASGVARFAGFLTLILAGCAVTPTELPTPAVPEATNFAVGPLAAVMSGENGMELRKWIVPDDPEAIAEALDQFTAPLDDDDLRWELQRNGYQLLRLRAEDVEPMLAAFGPAVSDLRSWQGQAPRWREVVRRGARTPIAAFVDGRVRVFEDGALRLMMRSWSLPTEEGVLMQLEFTSEFEPAPRGVLRDLVREGEPTATRLPPGTVELQCVDGDAWLLTSTGVDDVLATERLASRGSSRGGGGTDDARGGGGARSAPAGGMGPPVDDMMGPAAAPPQTVGEILLRTEMPATRTILIFVPRLPEGSVRRADPAASPAIGGVEVDPIGEGEFPIDAASPTEQTPEASPPRRSRGWVG